MAAKQAELAAYDPTADPSGQHAPVLSLKVPLGMFCPGDAPIRLCREGYYCPSPREERRVGRGEY